MSNERRRISGLGAHTLLTKLMVYAFGLLASILIARALGPTGRGAYYVPVTIATTAFFLGNMGTGSGQFRQWSRGGASHDVFVTSGIFMSAGIGALTALITWIIYLLGADTMFAGIRPVDVVIVLATLPIQMHSQLSSGVLTYSGYLPLTNVAAVAGAAVQTTGALILFLLGRLSVEGVLLLYGASIFVPWLAMLPRLGRIGRIRLPIPWRFMGEQLKIGIGIQPYLLFLYLNLRIDVLFVARYRGLAGVGLYSLAVLFAELVWLVTDSLTFSIIERQANASEDEAMDVTLRAVRMNLFLSLLVGAAVGIISPLAIRLLYGSKFLPAQAAVWALLPASASMAVWRPVGAISIRLAKPWLQSSIALGSLVINIVANALLIPRVGIVGAGLASTISYGFGALATVSWLFRHRGVVPSQLVPSRAEAEQLVQLLRPSSLAHEISSMLHR